jgi:hypothetical protein
MIFVKIPKVMYGIFAQSKTVELEKQPLLGNEPVNNNKTTKLSNPFSASDL